MNQQARLVRTPTVSGNDITGFRFSVKFVPYFMGGFSPDWPDVPLSCRQRILVSCEFMDNHGDALVGDKLHLNGVTLRLVEYDAPCYSWYCVIDRPLAFLSIWNARLHRARFDLAVFAIRLMRRAGLICDWADSAYQGRAGFPWRDVYVIDALLKRIGR